MIVVSIGMPKSGSTLFSFYQKEIIGYLFPDNGQRQFEQAVIDGKIKGAGHFVQDFNSREDVGLLLSLAANHGPYLIKSHSPLNLHLKELIMRKKILVTFIHRDPRDVILSAIDHGKRKSEKPAEGDYFRKFSDVEHSIPLVRKMCQVALEWKNSGLAHIFKYYDLLSDPVTVVSEFCNLIDKSLNEDIIHEIIVKYTGDPKPGIRQFNTGKKSRFQEEMTLEEIILCNNAMKEEITALGYMI